MRSESISLSYPWCKSFRNHYFHCYYFQSVAWYFLQNLLLCTVQASEFWKTTIEVMISYKTEMTTLISLIINVESRLLILKKESTLHVYWSLRFLPPSTPRLLHLCASFFFWPKSVFLKSFGNQQKTVHLQGPHSMRPHILRPCLISFLFEIWKVLFHSIDKVISEHRSNPLSPYLSALDFLNFLVWNFKFVELDFFPSLNWIYTACVTCKKSSSN